MGPAIDVHGMSSEDALRTVCINIKEFHDRGYNEVFVVHGKGKGILRQRIRGVLGQIPYVREYRSGTLKEGGEGVTVVNLSRGSW